MKKIIIISFVLLIITGCGMSKEEKQDLLYNSLEKAYKSKYIADGVGLAVYQDNTMTIDGVTWFKVANSEYDSLSKLTSLANDVYPDKIAEEMNKIIEEKYFQTDTELYAIGKGGCSLDYELDEKLLDNIKRDVKIKKVGMTKIKFEYKGKEYTAKKSKNNYIFEEKIFECKEA